MTSVRSCQPAKRDRYYWSSLCIGVDYFLVLNLLTKAWSISFPDLFRTSGALFAFRIDICWVNSIDECRWCCFQRVFRNLSRQRGDSSKVLEWVVFGSLARSSRYSFSIRRWIYLKEQIRGGNIGALLLEMVGGYSRGDLFQLSHELLWRFTIICIDIFIWLV